MVGVPSWDPLSTTMISKETCVETEKSRSIFLARASLTFHETMISETAGMLQLNKTIVSDHQSMTGLGMRATVVDELGIHTNQAVDDASCCINHRSVKNNRVLYLCIFNLDVIANGCVGTNIARFNHTILSDRHGTPNHTVRANGRSFPDRNRSLNLSVLMRGTFNAILLSRDVVHNEGIPFNECVGRSRILPPSRDFLRTNLPMLDVPVDHVHDFVFSARRGFGGLEGFEIFRAEKVDSGHGKWRGGIRRLLKHANDPTIRIKFRYTKTLRILHARKRD